MRSRLFICSIVLVTAAVLVGPASAQDSAGKIGKTYDEVVALAKKEGSVRFATALFRSNPPRFDKVFGKIFEEKYGIDIQPTFMIGPESRERIMLEAAAGKVTFDVVHIVPENIAAYKKAGIIEGPFDWEGLFGIDPKNISPDRFMISAGATVYCFAYNPDLIPDDKAPKTWENLLDPYFKGKFVVNTRPTPFVSFYPLWGKEKTLDYAKALAANEPIWLTSWDAALAGVNSGEYPMVVGIPTTDVFSLLQRDPSAKVKMVLPTEVPAIDYFQSVVLKGAEHPNAALLLLGWFASPEGQKIFDEGYLRGSPVMEGTKIAQQLKDNGSKVSMNSWELTPEMVQARSKEVLEAWGFPTPK